MEPLIVDPEKLKKGADYRRLAGLLRLCSVTHVDEQTGYFWPTKLLSRIMTNERVIEALANECRGTPSARADLEVLAEVIHAEYLKMFALLLLASRGGDIVKFIEFGLRDTILPLHSQIVMGEPRLDLHEIVMGNPEPYLHDGDKDPMECFNLCGWMSHEIDFFYRTQWRLIVPYFQWPGKTATVEHHNLPPQTILPWCRTISADGGETTTFAGGFGSVKRVRIDPSCHGFTDCLEKLFQQDQYFAVKSILRQDQGYFESEVELLKRVAPFRHRHLITILATFSLNRVDHIMLPYADYNLWDFWKAHDGPLTPNPKNEMLWIASQILGIVDAVALLHNENLRHGDIKPENILCFQSITDSSMNLVLADFGLGRAHDRATELRARTTVTVAVTMAYRAPESDMRGIVRSRLYDIWCLGCLFLEMAGWILGRLDELQRARRKGGVEEAFFDVDTADQLILDLDRTHDRQRLFSIKPEVTRYISELHSHDRCVGYMHEFLDIIEHDMLLVDPLQRATSQKLLIKLKQLQDHAIDDPAFLNSSKPRLDDLGDLGRLPARVRALPVQADYIDPNEWMIRNGYRVPQSSSRFSGNYRSSVRSKRVTERKPKIGQDQGNHEAETTNHSRILQIVPETDEAGNDKSRMLDISDMLVTPDGPVYVRRPPLNLAQEIDESVSRAFSDRSSRNKHEITIEVNWHLQQCIQDELEGSFDLGSVLTISGSASHSWAVSCLEYVEETWAHLGVLFLQDLVTHLRRRAGEEIDEAAKTAMVCEISPVEAEATRPQNIKFKGTVEEISTLSQILSWIAATFRLPVEDQLSGSSIDFALVSNEEQLVTFRITLKDLDLLESDEPGTCWKVLFPSTIIAINFPVPQTANAYGLQIPFDAMLETANVLDEVNLEDEDGNQTGVYFDGVSYVLYATGYIKDENTVQWHVKSKSTGQGPGQAVAPDYDSPQKWVRWLSIDILTSAKAVLGYCGEVEMHLGTKSLKSRFKKYRSSRAPDEEPAVDIAFTGLTAGANTHGANTAATFTVTKRKAFRIAQEDLKQREYDEVIGAAEGKWVILLETSPSEGRAWMVPKLSMILELYNYWALKKGLSGIRYAASSPNGHPTAKEIFDDIEYVGQVVVPKIGSDAQLCMSDIVKRIGNRVDRRVIENKGENLARSAIRLTFGGRRVTGWDWLDLAFDLPISDRKKLPKFPRRPNWFPFTKEMPVFFGQNLGQLVTPAKPDELCLHWRTIPGGDKNPYLVASVAAIIALPTYKNDQFSLGDQIWELKDRLLFLPCERRCIIDPIECRKLPQILVKKGTETGRMINIEKLIPSILRGQRSGRSLGRTTTSRSRLLATKKNGAMVFANELKEQNGQAAEESDADETGADEPNVEAVDIHKADAQGVQVHDAAAQEANVHKVNVQDADAREVHDETPVAERVIIQEANMQRIMMVLGAVSVLVHIVLVAWWNHH